MNDSNDFAALLAEFDQTHQGTTDKAAKPGDQVKGRVVAITEEQVFIDLGGKAEGVMDAASLRDAEGQLSVAVGDEVTATVAGVEEDGSLRLGNQQSRHLHGAAELEQAYRQQVPVQGRVTGVIKGGAEVQVAGQRAFCPASQMDIRFVEDLNEFVGQHLDFRITKFEGGRHLNLVVSRRLVLEEEQRARAEALRANLKEGAVLTGTVTSLQDYGAFVDLGGLEGMIHISELAFHRVKHPSEMLSVGQPLEVSVLRIDKTDNPKRPEKIALSIRALARDPWAEAAQKFPVGARVQGQVTRLQPFGAFVELAPGIEGLIHVSELGTGKRITHPQEVLSPGQALEASVLAVDLDKRRISLTLDEAKAAEAKPDLAAYAAGTPPTESGMGSFGALLKQSLDKGR
ncbi:MAG: 30S ribosomal protein S1 [Gammaproteobacteria bacterium]|jgi:small subunit ribosomal protein S1|nr:30S ribosomal protein S1 [Gammaproteobacteria bacterium]